MSEAFEPNNDPFDPPAPQKKGMSGTVKVLLIVFSAFGLLCLACCGGMAWMGRGIIAGVVTDHVKLAKIGNDIIGVDAPEGFTPVGGFDGDVGDQTIQVALFSDGTTGFLFVMGLSTPWNPNMDMAQEMQKNPGQQQQRLRADKRENIEIVINDQAVTFELVEGTNQHGEKAVEVLGGFPTNAGGLGLVMLQASNTSMSVEEAREFVDSLGAIVEADEGVPEDEAADESTEPENATEADSDDANVDAAAPVNEETEEEAPANDA